jgi:hypothetical protein
MLGKGFVKRKVSRSGAGVIPARRIYSGALSNPDANQEELYAKMIAKQTRPLEFDNEYRKPTLSSYGPPSPSFYIGEDGIAKQRNI